ncbi:MAG: helix-turn-helix transcriptional regulator [Bacteroides sp.]|nr:helix-turn-helix transcriptional regulator [Bacteroides sp.]
MPHLNKSYLNNYSLTRICYFVVLLLFLSLGLPQISLAKVRASVSKDYDRWQNFSFSQLKDKANNFIDLEMPDSALVCYSIMANRLPEVNSREDKIAAATAIMNVGYMYSTYFYDFHRAFDNFSKALKTAKEENDSALMASCYVNLGSLYSTYHQMVDDKSMLDEAINMYNYAYQISKQANYSRTLLTTVSNLGTVFIQKDSDENIRQQLNDFLEIDCAGQSERWQQVNAFVRGLLAVSDKDTDKASQNLIQSLSYKHTHDLPYKYEANILLALSINSLRNGEAREAEKNCLKVLSIAKTHDFVDIVSIAYRLLANIYDALGQNDKTNFYRLKYYNFKDSLIEASKIKDVKDLRFLEELNTKNEEVNQLATQKNRQKNILLITVLALVIAAIVLVIILINSKRLRRRNLELYDKLQESLSRWNEESMTFSSLSSPKPEPAVENTPESENEIKYKNSNLSDSEKLDILNRIKGFMATSDAIYSPDFTLYQLAEILDINRTYLSQVINETGGSNFKTLLNSYRILEACRRFEDVETYGGQTIEAIGQSVGFLSRRNFGIAFKKETGLSPSVFVKTHQEKQNER